MVIRTDSDRVKLRISLTRIPAIVDRVCGKSCLLRVVELHKQIVKVRENLVLLWNCFVAYTYRCLLST